MLDSEQRMAAMQIDSPQIMSLRREEEQLIAEYKTRGGKDPNSVVEPDPHRRLGPILGLPI